MNNCPLGKKDPDACWDCLFNGSRESNILFNHNAAPCVHPDYEKKKSYKVKLRKIRCRRR